MPRNYGTALPQLENNVERLDTLRYVGSWENNGATAVVLRWYMFV